MGLSARCGRCRCECAGAGADTTTTTTTSSHGDVVRNRNSNNDDPDAVLEGVAMAGLVAILCQLGDLAELAAEVFDEMQDQVMAASARGRRLAVRAKRLLEADLHLPPSTHQHSSAAAALTTTSGRLGCGAHLRVRGGGGGGGTPPMPRLVVQRIRRCRGPPRLSLLDKFDAAGEGACLKRYTDPSFFFRAHSAKTELIRIRAKGAAYLLKPMEISRPKFQTTLNSEPPSPEPAHTVTDCKSETEPEPETDASEPPSPGFLSMLRQLKQQHRRRQAETAGAGSLLRMQQTAAVHRVQSSPQQLNMEQTLQGGGTGTAQPSPSPSPSPSELERTSSFEAWLSPDARRFTTPTPTTHHHHEPQEPTDDGATTSNADAAPMLKATQNSESDAEIMGPCNKVKGASASNKSRSRYKGSVDMIASRVSSLPRKLFSNIKHHNDCSRSHRAGSSIRISQATGIGDCSPQLEAIPTPREAFLLPILLHSDPENDECYAYLQHHESISCNVIVSVDAERHHQQEDPSVSQCSNSNSSTPETCAAPDSKNLLSPETLVLKRAGALPPENSSSEDAIRVDTTPPLPPIPPVQWLSEKVHRAASPKHRALWKKSLEVGRADRPSNDALRSVRTQVAETIQATSEATSVSNENANANASPRDGTKCSEETSHPQPLRVQEDDVQASPEGIVLKAGEFPAPAILSDEAWSEIVHLRTQAQADTCFQQQGRQQFGSSGHSDEKRSEEHEASDESSNLQNESVFFSAVQELAKMSPPSSVPIRPKYSLLDAVSQGRITLRNGPSLIHPSRNILDSRSVLIEQLKDIAMAGNPSFKLKPVSGASSPVTGSPTNSKVATILQRADDIRQAHANSNDVDSEESWSDDGE